MVRQREGAGFLPVGDQLLIPLPIQNGKEILRPRAGHPVGVLGFLAVAGTAGEGDDRIDTHLFRQQNRIAEISVVACRQFPVGVQGVAVRRQGADLHVILFEECHEGVILCRVSQQLFGVAVRLAGVAARAELHRVDVHRRQDLQRFLQGFGTVQVCQNTQFHGIGTVLSLFDRDRFYSLTSEEVKTYIPSPGFRFSVTVSVRLTYSQPLSPHVTTRRRSLNVSVTLAFWVGSAFTT